MDENELIMEKLKFLKEIRSRTIQLNELKARLLEEIEATEGEEKCLGECKHEMELLLQEQMARIEELRLIHEDMKLTDILIKQSEVGRNEHLENAKQLHRVYKQRKEVIDSLRNEIGLAKLPELEEEDEDFKPEFLERLEPEQPTLASSVAASTSSGQVRTGRAKSFKDRPRCMKSCLSCQQQIDRNAAVCPLCTAKCPNIKKPKRDTDN